MSEACCAPNARSADGSDLATGSGGAAPSGVQGQSPGSGGRGGGRGPPEFFEKKSRFGGRESNENGDKNDGKMFMKNNLGILYRP